VRTLCITLPETPERKKEAQKHFNERGVKVDWLHGIGAKTFGLQTSHTYEFDHPGTGYVVDPKHVGLHLSHYMAWQAMALLEEDYFLLLEDDADFAPDWEMRFIQALTYCPRDTDLLFVGSCNTFDKPRVDLGYGNFHVKWPQCTHAYIVFKRALPILLSTQRDSFAPIDLSLILRSFEYLNVVTVLPRIVGQRGQEICA
jgi:GR25 family glycosyltransferase involved in LPS biosynthesis